MRNKIQLLNDTICAICTPSGAGSISVIRISGSDSKKIALKLFKASCNSEDLKHRMVYLGNLVHRGEIIDESICIFFSSPNSLTGQDVIEFHTHGGFVVPNTVLNTIVDLGARIAEPGEFSYRSFINGKIDLLKAEAISTLIASQSEASARCSTKNISGAITKKFNNLRQLGINLLSEIEARVDFPEEEIPQFDKNSIEEEFQNLINQSNLLMQTYRRGRLIIDGLRVLILGEPNVGKSTLLNSIINEEKAIVTSTPGTTRDLLDAQIIVDGKKIVFSDTAGMRITTNEIENIGIQKAKDQVDYSDLVLIVMDSDINIKLVDQKFDFIPRGKKIYILNKCDIYGFDKKWKIENELIEEGVEYIKISAKKNINVDLLVEKLPELSKMGDNLDSDEALLTTERQVRHLRKGIMSIQNSLKLFNDGSPMEIVSFEIREFLNEIGKITGEVSNEDIYDALFSKFCIGK